jgi:methylglutaconyl-CoA hydratase
VHNGVGIITLNRPKEKNSLDPVLVNSLGDNLKTCMSHDEVRVIVLTNSGSTFCAGANLKNSSGEAPRYTLTDILKLMQDGPKVIVGRINGHCTGGGVGLAAACDISVICSSAEVGFTEVRIGVCPAIISVVCLPKMRRADAAELMLSGEKIPADRAAQVGLLNYSVAADQLDSKVGEITNKIVRGGPNALAATKELVYRVPSMRVDEAFRWTTEVSSKVFSSQEARDGIAAFNRRGDAPWVPRPKL